MESILVFYLTLILATIAKALVLKDEDLKVVQKYAKEFSEIDFSDDLRGVITPGTKWCGDGNKAKNDDDLGYFDDTDRCCRAHDKCEPVILSKETKFNLTNTGRYTRLSCDCDEEFHQCLLKVNGVVSKSIGWFYFNVLGTQCFKLDNPIQRCQKYGGLTGQKCVEYVYNNTAPKVYSWFDLPTF